MKRDDLVYTSISISREKKITFSKCCQELGISPTLLLSALCTKSVKVSVKIQKFLQLLIIRSGMVLM